MFVVTSSDHAYFLHLCITFVDNNEFWFDVSVTIKLIEAIAVDFIIVLNISN